MTRNPGLKLFSLLLAMVLSYTVNSASNSSVVSLVVPIEVKNLPDGRLITKPTKRTVQVTIKGPSFMIGPVASAPPAIKVKLPANLEERYLVSFKASDLTLPAGVEILGFDPPDLEFSFDLIQRREIKVEVPRLGQLPKQLALQDIQIKPSSVFLTGPKSEIQLLRSVETEPIDLREVNGAMTLELRIRMPGTQVTSAIDRVTAHVEVESVPVERIFHNRPVELRSAPDIAGLKLDPTEVTVVIAGPTEIIATLDSGAIMPFVRIRSAPALDVSKAEVSVELPSGIRLVRVEPNEVLLRKERGAADASHKESTSRTVNRGKNIKGK